MNTDRKQTQFEIYDAQSKAIRDYFAKRFTDRIAAIDAIQEQAPWPAWKRAWWRVRAFLRSFVYVECEECGHEQRRIG